MFLGAGAVNKNQITANSMSDNFVFAELKKCASGRGNDANVCSPGNLKKELHSLPYKQPGLISTLIYIAVGHPQQAPLWWK